jgi:hypothetical protein
MQRWDVTNICSVFTPVFYTNPWELSSRGVARLVHTFRWELYHARSLLKCFAAAPPRGALRATACPEPAKRSLQALWGPLRWVAALCSQQTRDDRFGLCEPLSRTTTEKDAQPVVRQSGRMAKAGSCRTALAPLGCSGLMGHARGRTSFWQDQDSPTSASLGTPWVSYCLAAGRHQNCQSAKLWYNDQTPGGLADGVVRSGYGMKSLSRVPALP